jgi:hypothetical protein
MHVLVEVERRTVGGCAGDSERRRPFIAGSGAGRGVEKSRQAVKKVVKMRGNADGGDE